MTDPPGAQIVAISAAETGWKAMFGHSLEDESQSRVVAWGLSASGEVVGLIVDPQDRRRVVSAREAAAPDGAPFSRYAFAPPEDELGRL